jgi:ribosome biogenesis GTPase A
MLPAKKESGRPIMAMIVGIPNVGKSTLINTLAGKPVAKTGNEPAVTKGQQRINIGDGVSLMDTPGVMWPNVENPNSGSRLAAIGSIKDTAMDYAEVGFFLAKYLTTAYPDLLKERYGLEEISPNIIELMDAIGKKRGCLGKGGVVDWDRTSRILLTDFRSGKIGLVTLETPEMMVQEKKQVVITSAAKAEKKASRKEARRAKRKSDRAESKGKFKRRD